MRLLNARTKATEELAGSCKKVEKPNVNMEEECMEFARIMNEGDEAEAGRLEEISMAVGRVTSKLRKEVGVRYPADGA